MRRDGSALCRECGACCDGRLYDYVQVSETETLSQPCPHFGSDGACGIYLQRPKACRDFVCPILDDFLHGKVDLETSIFKTKFIPTERRNVTVIPSFNGENRKRYYRTKEQIK